MSSLNHGISDHAQNTHTITFSDSSSDTSSAIYTPPSPTSTMSSSTTTSQTTQDRNNTDPATASGTANISIREYIYFLPYPLPKNTPIPYSIHLPSKNPLKLPATKFEPTTTLVLTSPNHTFVDLRFYKPTSPTEPILPNNADRSRLEWGFAGTSTSTPCTDPHVLPGNKPFADVTHSKWMHWLDSRYEVGSKEIPVDEGYMYPMSPVRTLEVGHMWQVDLGEYKSHEEMWVDGEILGVSPPVRTPRANDESNSTATTTRTTSSTKSTTAGDVETKPTPKLKKNCIVLRLHDDEHSVRGVVIRVGQYIQGIVMKGRYSTVERWEWQNEQEGWKRTARVGDQYLPCLVTTRTDVLGVGGRIKYHNYEWSVEEVWEWA